MAFRVHLDMAEDTYHRVERYAHDRKQDIETAITELVENNLPANDLLLYAADPSEQEIAAFHTMHESLKVSFYNEYVAIFQGKLVDHDADLDQLFRRIDEQYPDHFVLIRLVGQAPEREFVFRSPRLLERAQ